MLRRFALLIFMASIPLGARAADSQQKQITPVKSSYSEAALEAFQKDMAVDGNSVLIPVLGYSSIQEDGIDGVDIFLASSPEDISAFRYLCDNLSTGIECTFHSMQARCFYYAQVGHFSMNEISTTLRQILGQENGAYENYKIWQFKDSIFSEVEVLTNGSSEKHYYGCQREDDTDNTNPIIRCEGTSSPVGNPP